MIEVFNLSNDAGRRRGSCVTCCRGHTTRLQLDTIKNEASNVSVDEKQHTMYQKSETIKKGTTSMNNITKEYH